MRNIVTFSNPQDVGPADLDGVVVRFPFSIRTSHQGAERDTTSEHFVDVQISGTLQTMWGLGDNSNPLVNIPLVKTLFEHARRDIQARSEMGGFPRRWKLDLGSGNSEKDNPFDPQKIPHPNMYSFEIESKKRIGF